MMDDGRWRMEDGRWKMEDGGWRMEDGRWKMEDGRWRMGDGRWMMRDAKGPFRGRAPNQGLHLCPAKNQPATKDSSAQLFIINYSLLINNQRFLASK
jgi:hypothetical protein